MCLRAKDGVKRRLSVGAVLLLDKSDCCQNCFPKFVLILAVSSIDLDSLRIVCHQLEQSSPVPIYSSPPQKPASCVFLPLPQTLTVLQYIRIHELFTGQQDEHLREFERKFNVRLNIVDELSSKHLRETLNQLKTEITDANNDYGLWVIITLKEAKEDGDNKIATIKQALKNKWEIIQVDFNQQRTRHVSSKVVEYAQVLPLSTQITSDTRWRPKRRGRLEKIHRKMKECAEQVEVAPQARVPSLPLPKVAQKSSRVNQRQKTMTFAMLE
jgi:hypothetical protein